MDGAVMIEERIEFALIEIGRLLRTCHYRFTTPTPETHRRVLRNQRAGDNPLLDLFGWSRLVPAVDVDPNILAPLRAVGLLDDLADGRVGSAVRFSTLDDGLFAHSSYPTIRADSVFFGPDTYRFCNLIKDALRDATVIDRIIDIGCGSGAGGIRAAAHFPNAQVVLADVNPHALAVARANVRINGAQSCVCVESDVYSAIDGTADLILSNPPYLSDPSKRAYRHGGGHHGAELSVRILAESINHLSIRGRLVLYTGSAIVGGYDTFFEQALPILESARLTYSYRELDPDVFGEELDRDDYVDVDRIAAVGLIDDGAGK